MTNFLEPLENRKRRRSSLAGKLKSLTRMRDDLKRALSDHKNFDPQRCAAEVSQLYFDKDQISDSLSQAETIFQGESAELQKLESETVSLFNIVNYFSVDQKLLRSKIQALAASVSRFQAKIKRLDDERRSMILVIDRKSAEIAAFQKFDTTSSEDELHSVESEMGATSNEIALLDDEIASINERVGSLIAEHEGLQAKVRTLKSTISTAENMDRELSNADNGYERAQIHEKCETRFGHGSPKKVRSDASRELRSIENNLPKLERRVWDELKKFEMVVSHIIID